jgi:hypothetical protein
MNEIWKAVVPIKLRTGETFEPYGYEVSNLGRVRSYRKRYGRGDGTGRGLFPEPTIINGRLDGAGYVQYLMYARDKSRKNVRGHVLVMQTFMGYPEEKMVVCHYDDIPTNNALHNLRYDTMKANSADKIRNNNNKITFK